MLGLLFNQRAYELTPVTYSRQINTEAYAVMVRMNRFVLVRCGGGIPMQSLLASQRVPVVTDSRQALDSFKGYALSVGLLVEGYHSADEPPEQAEYLAPSSFMVLARDLDIFCSVLQDLDQYRKGTTQKLHTVLTLGPHLQATQNLGAFAELFTEKTQQAELQPFRSHVRGIKGARVRG
jgi:hypothetical protein